MARVEKSYADVVAGWKDLRGGLTANVAELSHLELHAMQLAEFLEDTESLSAQQAIHTSAKQQVTKQIEELIDLGQKLATFLRSGVKQRYGNRSEKLVEFGLQPFRGKKRPAEPIPPPVEQTPPGEAVKPDTKE